jgi:hypothetical protein
MAGLPTVPPTGLAAALTAKPGVIVNAPVDLVNHPPHYTFGKYEVLDVLMDWFPQSPLMWQVVKYIARAAHKGNLIEDLKKAQFYLNKQIEILEKK